MSVAGATDSEGITEVRRKKYKSKFKLIKSIKDHY